MDRNRLMKPLSWRRLTSSEREIASEMFGTSLDAGRVRILALPGLRRAFVAGPALIAWPSAGALADFADAALATQATLVHELAHVWQAQHGVFLPIAKLRAGDGAGAYAYDLADGPPFAALNIEQQASVVEHAFLASRGSPTPYDARRYAEIAPAWRRI